MAEQEQQCEPWCQVGSAYPECIHMVSSTSAALPVSIMKNPGEPARVVIFLAERFQKEPPLVSLDEVQAQALSTMLAFAAPSPPTAELGVALAKAAAVLFQQRGEPDVGPYPGAFNPWKPDR